MIRIIKNPSHRVLAAELTDQLTMEDYEEVLVPEIDRRHAEHPEEPLRLVLMIDKSLDELTPQSALADIQFGFAHCQDFERIAIVSDNPWLRVGCHLMAPLIKAEMKLFHTGEQPAALDWAGVDEPRAIHRINRKQGVVTIKPRGELERSQIELLERDVDEYLKNHHQFKGVLLEVTHFPGWQDFSALARHVKLVKGHQERLGKVAIISDALACTPLPLVADLVLSPQVRAFKAVDRKAAREWITAAL